MGRSSRMANQSLIFSRGFKNNIIGDVDTSIENIIISNLSNKYVLINTTWLEISRELIDTLDINKIAVCYSGPDWENTNCIDIRKQAHELIKKNSLDVIHVGNSDGKFYFNFWAEFIRQNPWNFIDERYLKPPTCKKLFMCLNRKPHRHRLFLIGLLEEHDLLDDGYISIFRENSSIFLNENLSQSLTGHIELANNAVIDDVPIKNDIISLGDSELWNNYFINVVTETTVHTDFFISEKTWKPIIGLRPFLILGDYNIYNFLKSQGFDTFDDLFGTWYKDQNWEHRANSIVDILKFFKNQDITQIYNNIKPRLIDNRNCFLEFIKQNYEKIKNTGNSAEI